MRRRRHDEVGHRHNPVEPLHDLGAPDYRAMTVLMARDLGIGGDRDHAVAERPFGHSRLPYAGDVEVLAILERHPVILVGHRQVELADRDQASTARERLPFGSDEPVRHPAAIPRIGAPCRLHHLDSLVSSGFRRMMTRRAPSGASGSKGVGAVTVRTYKERN